MILLLKDVMSMMKLSIINNNIEEQVGIESNKNPHLRRCFGLVINQSVGSCREKLIPEVGVVDPLFAIKGYFFYTKYVIYLCIVF